MSSALSDYLISVGEVTSLVSLIEKGSQNQQLLIGAGFDPQLLSPSIAGAVVLLVGRFEQFVKDIGARALDFYSEASPAITRTQLSTELQAIMLFENLTAAAQKRRHGIARTPRDRVASIDAAAVRVVAGEIWGDDVVQTYSNPSSDTVREAMAMLGIKDPWKKINTAFQRDWLKMQKLDSSLKAVPSPQAELDSVLGWRNSVAHSRSFLTIGAQELIETMAFFQTLGTAMDNVLRLHVEGEIRSLSSVPASWG